MKYIRLLFYILFISMTMVARSDENIGGLSFRAYEYSKDKRTSFIIPSGNQGVGFKDFLSVSFDLKIRGKGEHFGYVCRMIIDNGNSLDLILINPVNEKPYLCFIKDSQYLEKMRSSAIIDIHEWNRLKIELEYKNDTLYVRNNTFLIFKEKVADSDNHSVKCCFGANKLASYATSDVAPIVLKNVQIGLAPGRINYEWSLEKAVSDTLLQDKFQEMPAFVSNPEWLINSHMYWNHRKTLSFSSKVFPVPCETQSACYFIAKDHIVKYDLIRGATKEYVFSPLIDVNRISNQFLFVPLKDKGGQLVYYDFEKPGEEILSFFDFQTKSWSVPIQRERQSSYIHHNRFFNQKDSSIVQILGYGFHLYTRELNRISLSGEVIKGELPDVITPRYLSAIGKTDSLIYIYGGLGNDLGKQEYGIVHYRDLYELNLNDYSLKKKWAMPENLYNEAAASTLIVDEVEKVNHAKGLFFSPGRFLSSLVLKDLNLENGKETVLGDTIPFTFLDVNSYADLIYLASEKCYYAVTVHQVEENHYEANIYSIVSPVLPIQNMEVQENRGNWWNLLLVCICVSVLGGIGWRLMNSRKHDKKEVISISKQNICEIEEEGVSDINSEKEIQENNHIYSSFETPVLNTTPGIYMLNGFQVINRDNKNITGKFTPIMRKLVSVIILYSNQNNKGISNTELKELFWYDKSEKSFSNNRSVNIRKIRLLLEEVGDAEISSANGYWYFLNKGIYNDYTTAYLLIRRLASIDEIHKEELEKLLNLASFGQLLPDMQFDWVDSFKADYSDSMIELLSKLRDSKQFVGNDALRIQISNCILRFDSLDEESVRVKCRALMDLKRTGMAYTTFDQFTKEYKLILNEDFKYSFEQFVSETIVM